MRAPYPPEYKHPDVVLIDPGTGYAMNVPVVLQDPSGWWEAFPEKYEALKIARAEAGIEVDDFPAWAMTDTAERPKRAGRLVTLREFHEGDAQ